MGGTKRSVPRRGLVLGGGGVLGAAWMVGALAAVEDATGKDLTSFDYIVGTSAGAVIAALLGAGFDAHQLLRHQLGEPVDERLDGYDWDYETATGGSLPPRPKLSLGSPAMFARNVHRLHRMPPTSVLSAFLPEGRGSLQRVGELVQSFTPAGQWSPHPGVWIVAMDYETGRRVPFGRPGEVSLPLSEAVMASCAIPGWFAPVVMGGHRYVDGGTYSATSVDVLRGLGLDEVYVVAPIVSFEHDRPQSLIGRLERRWRASVTRRCVHESVKLRAEGTEVSILGPGPEDLIEIGGNVMDVSRRTRVLETSLRTSAAALVHAREWADAS